MLLVFNSSIIPLDPTLYIPNPEITLNVRFTCQARDHKSPGDHQVRKEMCCVSF